jgi:hypothetical protein
MKGLRRVSIPLLLTLAVLVARVSLYVNLVAVLALAVMAPVGLEADVSKTTGKPKGDSYVHTS